MAGKLFKSEEEYKAAAMLLGMEYVEWCHAHSSGYPSFQYYDADTLEELSHEQVMDLISISLEGA